jgi:hypothetical protein
MGLCELICRTFRTMLKRISLLALGLMYLLSTVTTVIDVHYCMGRLTCVQWEHPGVSPVVGCGMRESSGTHCCRTEVKVFKVSDDHQRAGSYFVEAPMPVLVSLAFSCLQTPLRNGQIREASVARPPPKVPASLTVLYGNFRI